MKALVYKKPLKFDIEEVDMPRCGDEQILIKVKSCGICGSDVHFHKGEMWAKFPLTPGHEFAGVVEKVGSKVTKFKPGDRVVADSYITCGKCYWCKKGMPLYCEDPTLVGVNTPGGFAEYVLVNESWTYSISNNLSFDEATLVEPTACAIHGADRIDVQCGDDILIFGAGPTGIILAQLMKHCGAANLVVAAPTKKKLDIIDEIGIGKTIIIDRNDSGKNEKNIKEMFPRGFDIVIDATGARSIVENCSRFSKKGGKVVLYGLCGDNDKIVISPYEVMTNELKIIGSCCQWHNFERALKYLENKIIKVDKFVSHKFSLIDWGKAIDTVINERERLKVVINP